MDMPTEAEVRSTLERVLAWDELARSPQLSAFLRYVVEARLADARSSIKAYAIAVDVFGRPESFDPQKDPIVRVQARRLRDLIDRFFTDIAPDSAVVISIPVGGYVPQFSRRHPPAEKARPAMQPQPQPQPEPPAAQVRSQWQSLGGVVLLAALFWGAIAAVLVSWSNSHQPAPPSGVVVFVSEFENLAVDAVGEPVAAGLGPALIGTLDDFVGIDARFDPDRTRALPQGDGRPMFRISGVARRVDGSIEYSAVLEDERGAWVDNFSFVVTTEGDLASLSLGDVAARFAARFGDYAGPLHSGARDWLAQNDAARVASGDVYPCLVSYVTFRRGLAVADAVEALACLRAVQRDGPLPLAQAMEAAMTARHFWPFGTTLPGVRLSLEDVASMADSALAAAPAEPMVWELAGFVALVQGDLELARARFNSALQINPASIDGIAAYAIVDAFAGNWGPSLRRAIYVRDTARVPSGWHTLPLALNALRQERFDDVLEMGSDIVDSVPVLGSAVLLAAGAQARDDVVVGRYLPEVIGQPVFQGEGVLPALRRYLHDPNLLAEITQGLTLAGLTLDRLTGSR